MTDTSTPRTHTRDDKHHQTSLRVERSAVSLVLEHGFDNVTVDMICAQSGISQRTFFNYFKTKKAAIIGAEPATIDEGQARAFIAAPGDDLLPDVLTLMSAIGPREGVDEQLFTDRLRIFGVHPELMQEQMERMTRVTSEITELVYLRLGRGAAGIPDPGDENDVDPAFRHGQAELITHAMLGVVRFMALQWIPDCERPATGTADRAATPTLAESLNQTTELLRRTLRIPGL